MARLADQFDAVLHFDETRAVQPLPHAEEEQTSEVPETYPTGVWKLCSTPSLKPYKFPLLGLVRKSRRA
jgi:hypothetical protein